MSDSKGITTKAIIIIIACVIVVGLGGYFGWRAYQAREAVIPSDLLFQSESDEIPGGYLLAHNEKLDTELIYSKGDKITELYCRPSNKKAKKIKYSSSVTEGMEGGWSHRYAYICGDKYWILDACDSFGWKVYGPFEREKPVYGF